MANPSERRGKSTQIRAEELHQDAKMAADAGGGFSHSSWSEVARGMAVAVGRPTASNAAKAAGGVAITFISPPLAALAGTVVGSLSVVGDGMVDMVWGPVENWLWQKVDGDDQARHDQVHRPHGQYAQSNGDVHQ